MEVQDIIKEILQNVKEGHIDTKLAFRIIKNLKETQELRESRIRQNDIAIIGIACRFPDAKQKLEYWSNIENKKCSINKIPLERKGDIEKFFLQNGLKSDQQILDAGYLNDIDKFDASFFKIPPKEAALINPIHRLFFETSYEAFEDAGYGGNLIYNTKTGVYVGIDHSIEFDYAKYYGQNDILSVIGSYSSILANRISYHFNLRGPAMVIDTACSSGLVAVHQASQGLINHECDMAIAGGINLLFYREQTALSGVESKTNIVKAFDKDANGTVWGEGVGVILLKPLVNALADGDNVYAVIKGSAVNSNGSTNGITAPNAEAQTELLVQAWSKANIDPSTIDYIETHGTGTVLGDPIEIKGINDAFRKYTQKRQFCAINSIKNNIGHTCGASGLASLIKVVLSLLNKKIPANINFDRPNPFINFLDSAVYVNDQLTSWETSGYPRRAGVSAFGLSGTNCHVVVEEAPARNENVNIDQEDIYVLALSSQYHEGVIELVKSYYELVSNKPDIDLKNLCITANTGRGHYTYRLIVKFTDINDLKTKLERSIRENNIEDTTIKDVYYGKHKIITDHREECKEGKYTEKEIPTICSNTLTNIKKFSKSGEQYHRLLEQICISYVNGEDINWSELYNGRKYQKISLPTYPYLRKRCWVENTKQMNMQYKQQLDENIDTFYNISWIQKDLRRGEKPLKQGSVLVFKGQTEESLKLIHVIKEQGESLIEVTIGESYQKLDDNNYIIDSNEDSYVNLFANFTERNLTRIIHLQSINHEEVETSQQFEEAQQRGVMSLYYMTRALFANKIGKDLDIVLIANNVNEVTKNEEIINPQPAALFGLGKVVDQEHLNLHCRCIDIDSNTEVKEIVQELEYGREVYQVVYRNGQRFIEEFQELDVDKITNLEIDFRSDGVYIITGGMGGIGLEFSKYLASKCQVKLALFNRSVIPDRKNWDEIVAKNENTKVIKKIVAIQAMEAVGAEVNCYSIDVSNYDAVNMVLDELRQKYGKINGIIHSAGLAKDGFVINKDEQVFQNIIGPKMEGTWLLDKLTEQDDLDFFIVFSSIASLLGGTGKGDYAAANAYLDAYTAYRSRKGKRTLSINWPVWKDTGMAVEHGANHDGIFKAIETNKAIRCFEKIFNKKINSVFIGIINNTQYRINYFPIAILRTIRISYLNLERQQTRSGGVLLRGKTNNDYTYSEIKVGNIWSDILGLDEIHIDDDFYKLGGNSILAIQMEVGMENNGFKMSANDLQKQTTIREIAKYFDDINNTNKFPIIIDSIIAFNDVFYKDCFYNSLFPIINHYKADIGYFLANDIIVYKYNKNIQDSIKFEMEYLPAKDEKYAYNACGVSFTDKDQVENIIDEAKSSISSGRPVIVWVDCFYESIRNDAYKKEHLPHTLLLYGFDDQEEVFYIVEHSHKDNLSYEKCRISYEELKDSYNGYLERFRDRHRKKTFYEFYANNNVSNKDMYNHNAILQILADNILNHKNVLLESVENTRNITSDIREILLDEVMLKKDLTQLVKTMNHVINAKQVERYRLMKYFDKDSKLLLLLQEITNSWDSSRAIIVKYMFTSVYQKESVKNILKFIENIPDLEYKFVILLVKELKNYSSIITYEDGVK